MDFDEIVHLFQKKSAKVDGFGGNIRLDVEGEGSIMIDGRGDGVKVSVSNGDADTLVTLTLKTFQDIISGDLNPAMALMGGKLSVGGNMSLAMKLQAMLGDDKAFPNKKL